MSDTQGQGPQGPQDSENIEKKAANIRSFTRRSFELAPVESDSMSDDELSPRPTQAVKDPTEEERINSEDPNNVIMFDQSKVCPSKYFDSKTAEQVLLNGTHPDGSKRDFYTEFTYRLSKYRRDIYEGKLPPEAVFYDFPEELYNRTPEQVKEFFDKIVFSTGIGKDELKSPPMDIHPFLFRLFRRIDSDKLENAAKLFLSMRNDVEKIRKRQQEEEMKKNKVAETRSSSPINVRGNDDAAKSMPKGMPNQPMGMEGIRRRLNEEAPTVPGSANRSMVPETYPSIPGYGPVQAAPVPAGLVSGILHGFGKGLGALGAVAYYAGYYAKKWISNIGAHKDGTNFISDIGVASDSENGNDWDIEAIESDCRDLVECAAWTKEAANQGPVADALKELDDLAARRGLSKDAMWKNVHEVARGALQDNELKTVVDNLSKAIESVDVEGRLLKMAEAKERVESASRRILDHLEQGKGIDALKLKRFENAMDSLKNADAAFEKPGEEKELQRIAEMGRRIADMIKRLINRILGRSQDAEEVPPPPSP